MRLFTKFLIMALAVVTFASASISAQNVDARTTLDRQIEKKINMLPYYEVFDYITYKVDGNTVILSGKVLNGSNRKGAEYAVKRIDGVVNVVNNIEYLPAGGFDDTIRRQLYANIANMAGLSRYLHPVNPDIRLIVERGNVTLEGYVSTQTDANLAKIAASTVPGVFSVTNNLVVDKRAG